jgi:U3 small nucleolar RNA-associated protein 14
MLLLRRVTRNDSLASFRVRYDRDNSLMTGRSDDIALGKKSSKKRPVVRFADVDLDEGDDMQDVEEEHLAEGEEEEQGGDDDEFIDLLDALDSKGELAAKGDNNAFIPSDSDDVSPEALDQLQNFISTLNPGVKKRKAPDGPDASSSTVVEQSRKQ